MTAPAPRVSIVTATRNRPGLLGRALKSIKAQSFEEFESITVDDGSEAAVFDAYEALWSELDDRFRLVRPVAPGALGTGPSRARNRGIRQTQGAFVAFLDDDDEWIAPDHLAVGIESLETAAADYYFTNMFGEQEGTGEVIWDQWFPKAPLLARGTVVRESPRVVDVPLCHFADVMRHHVVHPDSTIVRREVLFDAGLFFERLSYAEDYDLMLRLADRSRRLLYRTDYTTRYRLPTGNSSSLQNTDMEQLLQWGFSAQYARMTCRQRQVRRWARAKNAWILREMARELSGRGIRDEAMQCAWEGFWTYPTLGAAAGVGKAAWQWVRRAPAHPPGSNGKPA
jgi:hypothetical protein